MQAADVIYLPESPAHDPEIELINEEAFGPGRFTRVILTEAITAPSWIATNDIARSPYGPTTRTSASAADW